MGGGLLQLVAYGAQDVYLTGNPQITFFKVVYRRHTNFAMEAIEQTFSGNPNYGNTVYCQISRNGDLIHRSYLEVGIKGLTSANSYVNYLGLRLLKQVSIEIGGQQIDKHYSDWLYIWNELSLPHGKRFAWDTMVGADSDALNNAVYATNGDATTYLYIPLEFWFCRNIGLSLPLIALQYHEVKIKIDFETFANCTFKKDATPWPNGAVGESAAVSSLQNPKLWVDYIYLDTDERRKFAQLSHEYLIEQLQFTGTETLNSSGSRIKLNFNHPCKELIWVPKIHTAVSQWYNYTFTSAIVTNNSNAYGAYKLPDLSFTSVKDYSVTSNIIGTDARLLEAQLENAIIDNIIPYDDGGIKSSFRNPFKECLLQLNGNDRFNVRDGTYFNLVQPYQHHTNIPRNRGINVYSFALKPEEHQPSGTLNMSRIDTAILDLKVIDTTNISGNVNIYAVNYNVLRILSGMGGLAYSN
jgi:hypothetical protein